MTPQERKVMKLALETLESSRIFVTSREKIKHPEGTDWYDERISAIKEALSEQAVVEHDLAAAYRTELDKLSQRNYELRMENAQLKAQPKEQEPVARVQDLDEVKRKHLVYEKGMDWKDFLYTTPPQRKPLTDEEADGVALDVMGFAVLEKEQAETALMLIRATETAHGIKETEK